MIFVFIVSNVTACKKRREGGHVVVIRFLGGKREGETGIHMTHLGKTKGSILLF